MLLVELHHLFVELLAIVAMLVLQFAHLRRKPLHLKHPLGALEGQWSGDRHDHRSDQRNRNDVIVGEAVEPGE